jgi:alpha-1,2-mannosyltransferase
MRLGKEALSQLVPELFIDTTGWAFTFPLARLAGSKVACYVHYPTISTNMIERVSKGSVSYNNDQRIAGSILKSALKLVYYKAFAFIYGFMGSWSEATMVNSSWTRGHIMKLWWRHHHERAVRLVYPPVDTEDLQKLPLDRRLKPIHLISIAQFRPEKDHRKQLEAFALSKRVAGAGPSGRAVRVARLKLVGSCRNKEDEARLSQLKDLASDLGISEEVDWCVNVPYQEMKLMLGEAVGGLHTMLDEHFGISVVEYQAAGVIPIAHDSGGPKADIVVSPDQKEGQGNHSNQSSSRLHKESTGFRAESVEEYAQAITLLLNMEPKERMQMASAARDHSAKFSTRLFEQGFIQAIERVVPKQ